MGDPRRDRNFGAGVGGDRDSADAPFHRRPVDDKDGGVGSRRQLPPGAQARQCAVVQTIVDPDRPNISLVAIALKTADRKSRLLRVIAPLGSLIPTGLGLRIDSDDMGRVSYVKCLPNGWLPKCSSRTGC